MFGGSARFAAEHCRLLSLIFWSVMLIVSVKYVSFVLRFDNHGEGGCSRCSPSPRGCSAATRACNGRPA